MPGISFLFKKKFHPNRIDNQKKVYLAEEQTKQQQQYEFERGEQVKKEQTLFEELSSSTTQDNIKDETQVSFLYSIPNQLKQSMMNKNPEQSQRMLSTLLQPPPPPVLDENGDDDAVRAFKAKLYGIQNKTKETDRRKTESSDEARNGYHNSSSHSDPQRQQQKEAEEEEEEEREGERVAVTIKASSEANKKKPADGGILYTSQSALEREAGSKQKSIMTYEEQVSRHPKLKNAPVEGGFVKAKNTQIKYKPFNELIRNVRCLRCGQWGHQSGDRECSFLNFNPLDYARQLREDPMAVITKYDVLPTSSQKEEYHERMVQEDPEEIFLNSLTRREKKLLLRKLQALEGKSNSQPKSSKRKRKRRDSSSSSSSSSDSSDSNGSSDSSGSESSESESNNPITKITSNERKKKRRKTNESGSIPEGGKNQVHERKRSKKGFREKKKQSHDDVKKL